MALVEDCLYNYYENSASVTRLKTYESLMSSLKGKEECVKLLDEYVIKDFAKALKFKIFNEYGIFEYNIDEATIDDIRPLGKGKRYFKTEETKKNFILQYIMRNI